MKVPAATAYMEALQDPSSCFADPELAAAAAVLGPLGLPRAVSGNVATVFRLDGVDGRSWAVRCFVRPVDDERERYDAIAAHLEALSSSWRVPFDLQPLGIRVDGEWWPIVKMAWAPGTALLPWVERRLWDGPSLAYLAVRFAVLVERLRADGVAHGDLQHGNVLVAPGGDLRLVDYDGMWVPALAGRPGTERGHRSYQHPGRQRTDFGPGLDTFSSWVIYVSLAALAADPLLWGRLDGGDEALLLREHDLADPDRSAGFAALEASPAPGVPALGALLRSFLDRDPAAVPPLGLRSAPPPTVADPGAASGAPGRKGVDRRRSLHEALGGHARPHSGTSVAPLVPAVAPAAQAPTGGGGGTPSGTPPAAQRPAPGVGGAPPFATALPAARLTVALAMMAVVVLGLAASCPVLAAGAGAVVVAALVRLHRVYAATPEACSAGRADEALAAPRRAAADAAVVVERLAAERAALDRSMATAEDEAATARAALRRGEEEELARIDDDLESALAELAGRERAVRRSEHEARTAALEDLRARVVEEHLGHQSLVAAGAAAVSDKVVHRLALDGVRTAADFTRMEADRAGAVVVARDGRRLTVGGVGPAQVAAVMTWRRQVEGAAQMRVPSSLPPERVAAIRAEHDGRRAALAAEADAAREAARRRAAVVRERSRPEEAAIATRLAAASVAAARRRVDVDRRLVTARKQAAEARWRLGEHEREHGAAGTGFAGFLRAVAGVSPAPSAPPPGPLPQGSSADAGGPRDP